METQLCSHIQYLLDRRDEFIALNKEGVENITFCEKDFIEICHFIESIFIKYELSDDFDDEENIKGYKTQLDVVSLFIRLAPSKVPKELLTWIICVFLDFISKLPYGHLLSGHLMEALFTFSRLLSPEHREQLLEEMISQWIELLSGSNIVCLNKKWVSLISDNGLADDSFNIVALEITFEEEDRERKACFVRSIINMMLYGSFDFTQLPPDHLTFLWLCLLKSVPDLRVSNVAISLMNRLICADLCNSIFFMECVDRLFSLLTDFYEETFVPTNIVTTEKSHIINSINACLDKIASLIVSPSSWKQLSKVNDVTFLPFASDAVNLILTFKHENWYLLKFVISTLKNIKANRNLGDFHDLPDKCKKLLHFLIITCEGSDYDISHLSGLFSFLVKFNGIDDTTKVVNELLESAIEATQTLHTNVRQTLVSALFSLPYATKLLTKVVPNELEICQFLDNLKIGHYETGTLPTSFKIYAKLAEFYSGDLDSLLSLLSLPWICDTNWSVWGDFQKSLPLLKPIKDNEEKFKEVLSTTPLKVCSLKAIARVSTKNEWRSQIFRDALNSSLVDVQIAALDALPFFYSSIPTYPFIEALAPMIESLSKNLTSTSETISLVQALVKALSWCICVAGQAYNISSDSQINCTICRSQKGAKRTINVVFPPSFIPLLIKIVEIEEEENELKIDFIGLLCSVVRHVQLNPDHLESLVRLSFPLIWAGGGIAASYIDFVEEIVQIDLLKSLWFDLYKNVFKIQDELLRADYFVSCGINAIDPEYSFKFIIEVILMASVRRSRASKVVEKAEAMVKRLTEKEKISPRTYFIRNSLKICSRTIEWLQTMLTSFLTDQSVSSGEPDCRVQAVIEHYFLTMATIFRVTRSSDAMDSMKAWLDLATPSILPRLFYYKQEDVKAVKLILTSISTLEKKPLSILLRNSLPRILWYLCYHKQVAWNDIYMNRIDKETEVGLQSMVRHQFFKCTSSILLALGKNEEICRSYLNKLFDIYHGPRKISFSYTECVRPSYLGILLDIRRSFSDDLYYHCREDIIKSLAIFINNLNPEFISQTASRMLAVLKAIVPAEASIDVWMTFLQKLVPSTLEEILQPILITVSPLDKLPGANRIIEFIFQVRSKADANKVSCQRFDRAVTVLYDNERRNSKDSYNSLVKNETLLESCSKMLNEESSDVQALVLPKLLHLCDKEELNFNIINELMHALLQALPTSSKNSRHFIGIILGKIGAIDPGRIGIAAVGDNSKHIDRRPKLSKFVDDLNHFFQAILELCTRLLIECTDADKIDFIAMSIQNILKELGSPDLQHVQKIVMTSLKPETLREIEPYKSTAFTPKISNKPSIKEQPYINDAIDYDDWLWKWYYAASDKIRDPRIGRIFKTLQYIYYSGDSRLPRHILPQVVLQGLIEGNISVIEEALVEIFGVFKKALISDGWIRLAAQTCFQLIEFIEKFEVSRLKTPVDVNGERKRVQEFLRKALSQLHEERDGELLSVTVAEKYNSSCRALRWLEQYAIKVTSMGTIEFNRSAMYALEKIYIQLSDTDGVLGAYEVIQSNATPSPRERVLAFEATGDYTEALPLYEQEPVQKLPLVKCLLRLNQPLLASCLAGNFAANENDDKVKRKLRDYQIEAAYRRGEWKTLDDILKPTNGNEDQLTSWGAHISSIFAGIKDQSKQTFEHRIERARMQVMDSLKAVTMEDADTYSQAYRYIQRLHILSEIEDAAESLTLFNPKLNKNYEKLLEKWKIRSNEAIQCSSVLEPIYWVRRELLRFANPTQNKDRICNYLLESCKLSRQAGHLSTSWAHLINARSLGVEKTLSIDMEEARYLFQKGQKGDAICSLQKSLEKYFPTLVKSMNEIPKESQDEVIKKASQKAMAAAKLEKHEITEFINTQLELISFVEKEKAADISDIYRRYLFVRHLDDMNEQQRYSLAVFYDNAYYGRNVENQLNVKMLIQFYVRVLESGNRFLLHVMPRMLTIWLDYGLLVEGKKGKEAADKAEKDRIDRENIENQRKQPTKKNQSKRSNPPVQAPPPTSSTSALDIGLQEITDLVIDLSRKQPYYFFTSFAQLISRICHPSELVYKALELIIADLMTHYPHECLWQSIASYRTREKDDPIRVRRIKQTYAAAVRKARTTKHRYNFDKLIKNYEKAASLLIEVAEEGDKNCKAGEFTNFNTKFYEISEFFKNKDVQVSIPFIAMVEKKMPTFLASQITVPDASQENTVYIKGFENNYRVFNSLARPKQITMIGSNGVRYSLIAKRGDELRKDARCMDFCRMVNNFLLRDPEARRRQLYIRTFSVIPLQAKGGIIEMVPNLTPLRAAINPVHADSVNRKWSESKGNATKRQKWYAESAEKNPPQIASYLRKTFVDPCKWYGARLAFTRTAATMSMVGFIMGLGDRHCENILIDSANGDIVHVDFNCLFNIGENLPVPELVPFRLTRNMIDGFGPTGIEGAFRKSCEVVMRVLRNEQATLSSVLQTFVHDPLLEWSKVDARNQQIRTSSVTTPTAESNEQEEITRIKQRLEGYIVSRKFYPFTKSSIPMSVEAQVAQLIRIATDPKILSEMFIGWNPHV